MNESKVKFRQKMINANIIIKENISGKKREREREKDR